MVVWQSACCLVAQLCPALCWTLCWLFAMMDYITPGFPVLHYLLEFAQTHVHWVNDTIQPSHPPLHPSPPALNEWALHIKQPKDWSFSFSISSSNKYSGLISFRIDLFDVPAVQGTLKGLLQHHSWKASILWHSVFFMVQLSHVAFGHTHTCSD